MRFQSRQTDTDTDINLTPLIDVVFLLLIFFMVTTTFSKEAQLKLQLPEATSAQKSDQQENELSVQIDALGQFSIKGAHDARARELINAGQATLRKALKRAAHNMTEPTLVIRADRLTPHESVVKAMDAARQEGLYHITFATDYTE